MGTNMLIIGGMMPELTIAMLENETMSMKSTLIWWRNIVINRA